MNSKIKNSRNLKFSTKDHLGEQLVFRENSISASRLGRPDGVERS
jgi:hypothetical protein